MKVTDAHRENLKKELEIFLENETRHYEKLATRN